MIAWWLVAFLYVGGMLPVAILAEDEGELFSWRGAVMVFLWPIFSFAVAVIAVFDARGRSAP